MNTELQQETMVHDVELPNACVACGGPLAARFTPGSARGVCLACHVISAMTVSRAGDGLQIVQEPGGEA